MPAAVEGELVELLPPRTADYDMMSTPTEKEVAAPNNRPINAGISMKTKDGLSTA
jgi:hypothetical protein